MGSWIVAGQQGLARIADLLVGRQHPTGFGDIRAQYIDSRVRLLAGMFAILTPLWIPVDFIILPAPAVASMALARILFSMMLLWLWLAPCQPTLKMARLRLVILMVLPSLFQIAAQLILKQEHSDWLISYTFLPMLIIAMHSIFPLTLSEGLGLASFTVLLLSLDELGRGTLFTVAGIGHLWLLCLMMGVAIWAQLSQLHCQLMLHRQSMKDSLTGLLNRGGLNTMMVLEHERLQREPSRCSVVMFDLDYFKKINDELGHQAGDDVIRFFSRLLSKQARNSDVCARYGGEEFVAVLPGANAKDACLLADRIHQALAQTPVDLGAEASLHVSCSVGISEMTVDVAPEAALKRADEALYQAKRDGRCCTRLYHPGAATESQTELSAGTLCGAGAIS
ncbi:MAG: GGDEF domain-containing protein [Candidatus Pelagadaptatus aseana]|uniref:GGDEF domain-containing protein n=1 Tax=Candidatus Pelagadaptatus aseana TaxID=3120508 RepID=UPI0039B2BF1A